MAPTHTNMSTHHSRQIALQVHENGRMIAAVDFKKFRHFLMLSRSQLLLECLRVEVILR